MAVSDIRPDDGPGYGKWLPWIVAAAYIGLLSLRIPDVFAGMLPGADDQMRLQQIRDLLAGQNWFNVDQTRMLTPEGGSMHWSRLPDLYIAGVIWLTEPLIGRHAAESLAAGTWPILLLIAAFAFLGIAIRRLGLSMVGQVFGFIYFATSAAIFNFWPGRIDHHGFVVVLTLGGLAAVLSPRLSGGSGIALALAITAMLSIALESLPYVAGLIAILGLFWIVRGHREGIRLGVFGLALVGFASLFYLLDAPGFGAARYVCDAYGTSHWVGLSLGGFFFVLLGVFGGALETWWTRLIAGACVGAVTLAIMVAVNPACLGDPYATVPDAIRLAWLSSVGEAKTITTLIADEPDRIVWVFGFLGLAVIATVAMVTGSPKDKRLPAIGFAILFALSIFATLWQIRGQSFSHAFAAIPAGWLAGMLSSRWRQIGGPQPLLIFAAAALLLSPLTWQTVSARFAKPLPYEDQGAMHNQSCTRVEAYQALAEFEPMRLHAPIILSSWVIGGTPHAVFAGPYHRNIQGISDVTTVLIGAPDDAKARLTEMGATHLLYCKGLNETNRYGFYWPDSFAAQLNHDELPDWLVPIDGKTETVGTVRIYEIVSD